MRQSLKLMQKRERLRQIAIDANNEQRREPRHPDRELNSRRSMKSLVRWRRWKATGHFSKEIS